MSVKPVSLKDKSHEDEVDKGDTCMDTIFNFPYKFIYEISNVFTASLMFVLALQTNELFTTVLGDEDDKIGTRVGIIFTLTFFVVVFTIITEYFSKKSTQYKNLVNNLRDKVYHKLSRSDKSYGSGRSKY